MLLDAYGARPKPAFSASTATSTDLIAVPTPFVPLVEGGGRWWFSGAPWVVEFSYGDAVHALATDVSVSESDAVIPELEKILTELGAHRALCEGISLWRLEQGGITLQAMTRLSPQGDRLVRVEMVCEAGILGPLLTRMSLRPASSGSAIVPTQHLMPLSNECVPFCSRVRMDGELSLEVIRSHETKGELEVRFGQEGWRRVSSAGESTQLWERNGKFVNVFDLQAGQRSSSGRFWVAALQE